MAIADVGQALEGRLRDDLQLEPLPRFDSLLDLKNLQGASTGYVRTWSGPLIEKASSLSINLAPFGRYFNINLIPDSGIDAPRFVYEGLLSDRGNQVSVDLMPDVDPIMDFDRFESDYATVAELFNSAKQDSALHFEPSRQAHIRALVSPFFLCSFGAPASALPALEAVALAYYEAWLQLVQRNQRLAPDETRQRSLRRRRIAEAIMTRDPDRPMVVQIYGEKTTQAIQDATML